MNARKRFAAIGLAACIAGAAAAAAAEEPSSMTKTQVRATFAGGCFWCMESEFGELDGIISATVGYTGGAVPDPSYEQVSSGSTGHAEAIEIAYDPATVSYEQLLEIFWTNIDPTQLEGQFADVGSQYRTAIFYHDETQRRLAEASKAALQGSGKFTKPIVTDIVPAAVFYPAEEHHQRYYKKNPVRYKMYKTGSGREGFLKRMWGR
jgi:methionine-S-sulfoxide reductase